MTLFSAPRVAKQRTQIVGTRALGGLDFGADDDPAGPYSNVLRSLLSCSRSVTTSIRPKHSSLTLVCGENLPRLVLLFEAAYLFFSFFSFSIIVSGVELPQRQHGHQVSFSLSQLHTSLC